MFNPYGLLESEREAGGLLGTCVLGLSHQANKFQTALALADYCDEQRVPHQAAMSHDFAQGWQSMEINRQFIAWKQLAADAGAITIYNFAELMQTIDGLVGQCPTAKEHMNGAPMKEARAIFKAAFPGYVDIRFGVAHAGKPFKSPDENERQRLPGLNAMLVNCLTERTLASTVNGKLAQYSLVPESHAVLARAAALAELAFAPVVSFTQGYNSLQQRGTL